MLYSIIPPIIIILCLAGIITLLVKKSKQIAQLPEENLAEELDNIRENKGFFARIRMKIKGIRWEDTRHFFLAILERITRRFRVIFLKLESRFDIWSTNIRSKRKAKAEKEIQINNSRQANGRFAEVQGYEKRNSGVSLAEESKEAEMIDGFSLKESEGGQSEERNFFRRKFSATRSYDGLSSFAREKEKRIKTIISEKLSIRKPKAEIKDRLEELLIERIAVNPKDIEAYERLGEYYLEIKSYTYAKECFKQVIKLNPANSNAKYKMKRLERLLAKK